MQILDILSQIGGLKSIASELGINESQATSGAAALIPAVLGGFKQQTQAQPTGLSGLGGLLNQLGGGGLLDNVLAPQPTDVSRGNNVLGKIFGSKDVSRAVAQNASTQSGLQPTLLKKMLPMLAMLVTGYLAKQQAATNATQPATVGAAKSGGGLLNELMGAQQGGTSPGGGLASMLDMNGNGNPLDDIMRVVGKFTQK